MAIVRRCKSMIVKRSCEAMDGFEGLEIVGRTFGSKRIAIANSPRTPVKGSFAFRRRKSLLESLPQELLVKVLCGVEHEDLAQLVLVSKTVKDAALIAKKWHFEYSTPMSKTKCAFKTEMDWEKSKDAGIQNAPVSKRYRQIKLNREDLENLAKKLFD